jgi:urocanate hydratase
MAYTPKNKTIKKSNKLKKLTDAQKKKLQEHSKHHTKKHMATMRMMMQRGITFDKAHTEAKKKVGK